MDHNTIDNNVSFNRRNANMVNNQTKISNNKTNSAYRNNDKHFKFNIANSKKSSDCTNNINNNNSNDQTNRRANTRSSNDNTTISNSNNFSNNNSSSSNNNNTNNMNNNNNNNSIDEPIRENGDVVTDDGKELRARYLEGVVVTTRTLLKDLVRMVFRTFSACHGLKSIEEYCLTELKCTKPNLKQIFTPAEWKLLKVSPCEELYGSELDRKILTHVWTDIESCTLRDVQELCHMQLKACCEPPFLVSQEDLLWKLRRLYRKQEAVRGSILKYCHKIIRMALENLYREQEYLKGKCRVVYAEIFSYNTHLSFLPMHRAILKMQFNHGEVTNDDNTSSIMSVLLSLQNSQHQLSEILKTLQTIEEGLEIKWHQICKLKQKINNLEDLYLALVRDDISFNEYISTKMKVISVRQLNRSELSRECQLLLNQEEDMSVRLKYFGKSDLLSHYAKHSLVPYDSCKWLLKKKAVYVDVLKVHTLLKRWDNNKLVSLDELLSDSLPQVTVVIGPSGSGKTCLCQYLFNKWCSGNYVSYFTSLDLLIVLKTEYISRDSFLDYIQFEMFQNAFSSDKICKSEILGILKLLNIFFVVDVGTVVIPDTIKALQRLVEALGNNKILITCRPEKNKVLKKVLKNVKLKPLFTSLYPVEGPELQELCTSMMKFANQGVEEDLHVAAKGYSASLCKHTQNCVTQRFAQHNSVMYNPKETESKKIYTNIERNTSDFISTLNSEDRDIDLFYPLGISYMLLLWVENSSKLEKIKSTGNLFQAVLLLCRNKLHDNLQHVSTLSKEKISIRSEQMIKQMYSIAYDIMVKPLKPHGSLKKKECDMELCQVCLSCLFPFLVCTGNKRHNLVHPCLAEHLFASFIINGLSCEKNKWYSISRRSITDFFPQQVICKSGGKFVGAIKQLCRLLFSKGSLNSATAVQLVDLYKGSEIDAENYSAWRRLLNAGRWSVHLIRAVSQVLSQNSVWREATNTPSDTAAFCELVWRDVYKPTGVILVGPPQKELIDLLASRPCINVTLLPTQRYKGLNHEEWLDATVVALRGAGNITELWANLKEEGAAALSSMRRLHSLHVHLSSTEALRAFSKSVKTCTSLSFLHLKLRLPTSVSPKEMPTIHMSSSAKVIFELFGTADKSKEWVVEVVRQLRFFDGWKNTRSRSLSVYLAESDLSSETLQDMKEQLFPLPIHISKC